jgi:ribonuclease HI
VSKRTETSFSLSPADGNQELWRRKDLPLVIATDASCSRYADRHTNVAAAGAAVTSQGTWFAWRRTISTKAGREGRGSSSTEAEFVGVALALKRLPDRASALIITDNLAVVQAFPAWFSCEQAPRWLPRGMVIPVPCDKSVLQVQWRSRCQPLIAGADEIARQMRSVKRTNRHLHAAQFQQIATAAADQYFKLDAVAS